MSHIPKRAAQHGLHLPGEETIPVALKPGQTELHRKGLYAQEARGIGETYMSQELPAKSEYARAIMNSTVPEHFLEARRQPRHLGIEASGGLGPGGNSHWRSEYKGVVNEDALQGGPLYRRQWGAHHVPQRELTCIGRPESLSTYGYDFGRYGSNPLDRLHVGGKKLPVLKSVLHAGTTKGTDHIPGYQGHIPACSSAPASARGVPGEATRSVDKTNMAQIYHTNLVGYAGHVPASFKNDRGGRKLTDLTTTGRDFMPHAVAA